MLKLPDGTVKVLVEGERRAGIEQYDDVEDCLMATVGPVESAPLDEKEADVVMRTVLTEFERYVKLSSKIPPEILTSLSGIDDPGRLADTVAAHLSLKLEDKQEILEPVLHRSVEAAGVKRTLFVRGCQDRS